MGVSASAAYMVGTADMHRAASVPRIIVAFILLSDYDFLCESAVDIEHIYSL